MPTLTWSTCSWICDRAAATSPAAASWAVLVAIVAKLHAARMICTSKYCSLLRLVPLSLFSRASPLCAVVASKGLISAPVRVTTMNYNVDTRHPSPSLRVRCLVRSRSASFFCCRSSREDFAEPPPIAPKSRRKTQVSPRFELAGRAVCSPTTRTCTAARCTPTRKNPSYASPPSRHAIGR